MLPGTHFDLEKHTSQFGFCMFGRSIGLSLAEFASLSDLKTAAQPLQNQENCAAPLQYAGQTDVVADLSFFVRRAGASPSPIGRVANGATAASNSDLALILVGPWGTNSSAILTINKLGPACRFTAATNGLVEFYRVQTL